MFRRTPLLLSAARAVVVLTAAAAATVACADKQPTQPKSDAAATVASPVAAISAPLHAANGSTVCLAYMNKRADAKVRLDKAKAKAAAFAKKKVTEPEADVKARTELKRRVDKFEALVTDACR